MFRTENEIINLAKDYGNFLNQIFEKVQIRLFGSYLKGSAKEWSDIDFAVISPDFKNIPYMTALKILNKARLIFSDEIEAIPLTEEDLKSPQLGSIEYEISKNSKKIF